MNKDMINIDDFVREKLGGHSEKEDPAAWLRMKTLLDEEMPERAAPFLFRWRKPAAFLGAALLIGSLCVGGYKLNALRTRGGGAGSNTAADHNNHPNNRTQAPSYTPITTHQEQNQTLSETENKVADDQGNDGRVNPSVPLADTKGTEAPSRVAEPGNRQSHPQRVLSGTNTTVTHSSTKGRRDVAQRATGIESGQQKNAESTVAVKQQITDQGNKTENTASQTERRKNTLASNNATATVRKANKLAKPASAETQDEKTANDPASLGSAEKDRNVQQPSHDSMKAITVVTKETVSRGFPKTTSRKTDTIASTNVPVPEKPADNKINVQPINNTVVSNMQPSKKAIKEAVAESKKANKRLSKAEAEQQQNNYAAATPVPAQSNTEKAETVKKQKSVLSRWLEGMNLPEAVASAKQDVRNAQFYPGITLGGNYSFSANSNNFQGVQFGPSGELVFNKHWSLFGAIRYFNRSGSTKSVSDNYSTEVSNGKVDSTKGANYYFTVQTDSTSRLFNFSTVHSFEMPLTVRYAFSKFYLMTGINLAYYLPVNVEQVEKHVGIVGSKAVSTNTTKPILRESSGQLAAGDFGSRFGLGYVLGFGCRITPAWHADLQLVNSFWDNSKGNGARNLSKDFYRLPSLQLSVGYQFNRASSRKATFGPTDQH